MSDFIYLNKCRAKDGAFASTEEDGFNGFFRLIIAGQKVKVIASDGLGWKHVSVSLNDRPYTPPNWEIMCKVKELFWGDEDWVVQFHPAKSEYVNNHAGCLHLWQPIGVEFPKPDSLLVGLKDLNL